MSAVLVPQAPYAVSTSTPASAGADPSARGVYHQAAQAPERFHGSCKNDGPDAVESQAAQGTPPGEIIDADHGDQKEAIISILEEWAAWERQLEEGTYQHDQKLRTEEIPAATRAARYPASSLVDTDNSAKTCSGPEVNDDSAPAAGPARNTPRNKGSSATLTVENPNQLLYASRRERRRAERHDPIARARRQALKVWAADQTKRRSSAEESCISKGLEQQQGCGLPLEKWAAMNIANGKRSSADNTVDHNRFGGAGSAENDWVRRNKQPPRAFAPREVSTQRYVEKVVDMRRRSQHTLQTEAAAGSTRQGVGTKPDYRKPNPHPWRANMKEPEKRRSQSAFDIAREGDSPTASLTARYLAPVVSSSSPLSSVIAGRGSAWAKSPSRETAGGILVKHCFFYGSSGKATPRREAVEAATASSSFESQWMRQFREEVQSNPRWWAGSDRFASGKASTSNLGIFLGAGKGRSGMSASRPTFPAALKHREDGSVSAQTTDLWNEVRSLLASGSKRPGGGKPRCGQDHEKCPAKSDPVDTLSFGERLRYTPLSQGAWLVAATASTVEQSAKSTDLLPEDGSIAKAKEEVIGVHPAGEYIGERYTGETGRSKAADSVSRQANANEGVSSKENVGEQAGDNGVSQAAGGKSSWQDLQSIHATTLAKLRGEIDPFTREELVLRAAEEARGALARDRARGASPRRASVGVIRPSSDIQNRTPIPDFIDYDKVEATLSLIELATRAAGPDAGRQMWQALEGLDKIHQRVSDEKSATEKERDMLDGKDGDVSGTGPESGLDGKLNGVQGSGGTSHCAPTGSTAPEEGEPVGNEDAWLSEEGGVSNASDQGAEAAYTVRAKAGADSLTSHGHHPGIHPSTIITGNLPSNGDREPCLDVEGGINTASSRRLSRKLSLVVSSSSEESADSQASSVGMMQTIGNWLWSNTPAVHSRRNSHSSDADDVDGDNNEGQKIGRNEFPRPTERSEASASEYAGTNQGEEVDSKDGGKSEGAPSECQGSTKGNSVREGGEAAVELQKVLETAIEHSEVKGSQPYLRCSLEPPPEQRASAASSRRGGEIDEFDSVQRRATEKARAQGSGLNQQDAKDSQPQRLPRGRPRRCSEADKPTGLPQLAAEIRRVQDSVSGMGDRQREALQERRGGGDVRRPDFDEHPTSSGPQVSVKPVGNEEPEASNACRRSESNANETVVANEKGATGPFKGAVQDEQPDGRKTTRGETPCGASTPAHVPPSKIPKPFQIAPENPSEDPNRDGSQMVEPRANESSSKNELQHRVPATVGGNTPVETEGIGGVAKGKNASSLSVPLHRDSWISVGTRPGRGNNDAVPGKVTPCVKGDVHDPSTAIPGEHGDISTLAKTEGVDIGSGALANNIRPTGGRYGKGASIRDKESTSKGLRRFRLAKARACLCPETLASVRKMQGKRNLPTLQQAQSNSGHEEWTIVPVFVHSFARYSAQRVRTVSFTVSSLGRFQTSTKLTGGAPGIVRRSPLIDALHPEVARQRKVQKQLRQTRRRIAGAPGSAKADKIADPAGVTTGTTTNGENTDSGARTTDAEKTAADAKASPAGAAHAAEAGAHAAVGGAKMQSTKKRRDAAPAAVVTGASPVTSGTSKGRRRRRSLWAETVPLPAVPLSVAPPPAPPSPARKPSRLSLVPTDSEAAPSPGASISRNVDSVTDAVSRAGRLTVLQWGCVEAWLDRARRFLGPKVWSCLGSSSAFRRTRGRIRRSIVVPGGGTWEADDPRRGKGTGEPAPGWSAKPPLEASGRARSTEGSKEGGRKNSTQKQARKDGTTNRDREKQNEGRDEEGERELAGGWDQRLSEKAALAIDAAIWTIATKRERTTTCATIAEAYSNHNNHNHNRSNNNNDEWDEEDGTAARQQTDRSRDRESLRQRDAEDLSTSLRAAAAAELRISLSAARRFIKSSHLADGVCVLNADVDLAFKRWEEVESSVGPDQERSSTTTAATTPGEEGATGHLAKRRARPGLAGATGVPIQQKPCEAVGCSDTARYGDIHLTGKPKLCRKHRRNGMVDVGSQRCERPGCGRLAVGAGENAPARATSLLCTLHARESRVDVEGLAFVLLALSKARHTRSRKPATTPAGTTAGGENRALPARNGELAGAESATLHASAVRNVLLTITEQPLVPGSPTMGQELLAEVVQQGPAAYGHTNNNDGPTTDGELLDRRVAKSTDVVRARTTGRSAAVASTWNSEAGSRHQHQHQRCGRRRAISSNSIFGDPDERGGHGPTILHEAREVVSNTRRRASATAASASAAAAAAAAAAELSPVSGAPPSPSPGPGEEDEDKDREKTIFRHGGRRHSHLPRREASAEKSGESCAQEGGGEGLRWGHHAVGVCEEVGQEGHRGNQEPLLRCRLAQRRDQLSAGVTTDEYGGGDDHRDDRRSGDQDHHSVVGLQQSRSSPGIMIAEGTPRELVPSLDAAVGSGGRGGVVVRRSGVDEVLEQNATSLQAVFNKFCSQSAGCQSGAMMMMTLADVLRFCDSFELRPGLVSTREIFDAYKEVAFPGVLGLSDEEIGHYDASRKSSVGTTGVGKSSHIQCASSLGRASAPTDDKTRQPTPSSANVVCRDDRASGPTNSDGKGATEPFAVEDATAPDAIAQGDSALNEDEKPRDLTLQDLALATDVTAAGTSQGKSDATTRTAQERGSNSQSRSRRGTLTGESGKKGAGSRRGTTQPEDDECSLYFRSDSRLEGYRMPSPSRRASTSSGGGSASSGRKGKRTVYLGRSQAFPLRRVESNLAVDARGFGLCGVCPSRAVAGDGSRRRISAQDSSTSKPEKATERAKDVHEVGGGMFSGDPSAPEASGLTEAQFVQWLKLVAVECKALTTKKILGHSLTPPLSRPGGCIGGGKVESGDAGRREGGRSESGCIRRQNAARAVVLLQWMEVSRGMRLGKKGGIPPFQISPCLENRR